MKFRKKPVVIEAMQNTVGQAETIATWMKSHGVEPKFDGWVFTILTLEGEMRDASGSR